MKEKPLWKKRWIYNLFPAEKPPHIITIYFGVPGSGKTTFAAWLTRHDLRRGLKVWSNVPITGAYTLDPQNDLGSYNITDGRIIIDEAGLEFGNRDWKNFQQKFMYFFKYHRHYETAIDFFSQGWNDCDTKIRTLAQKMYVVKKSILPFLVMRREMKKKIDVNEMSGEIIDRYFFVPLSRRWIFCPPLWKSFNTLSRRTFPEKEWKKW